MSDSFDLKFQTPQAQVAALRDKVKALELQNDALKRLLKIAQEKYCFTTCPADTQNWPHEALCADMTAILTPTEKRICEHKWSGVAETTGLRVCLKCNESDWPHKRNDEGISEVCPHCWGEGSHHVVGGPREKCVNCQGTGKA